jgi:hypothetical protein
VGTEKQATIVQGVVKQIMVLEAELYSARFISASTHRAKEMTRWRWSAVLGFRRPRLILVILRAALIVALLALAVAVLGRL